MDSPFAGRRTQTEILNDVAAGRLDAGELKLAYHVTIEKVDKSGDTPRLVETRDVLFNGDVVTEHVIRKH